MDQSKKFQKRLEDFTCEKCGAKVKGTGFTNHCPKCLWSRHMDVNPGDRASTCRGMMKPIAATSYGDEYVLVHECVKCGHRKRNKTAPEDKMELVIHYSTKPLKV